MFWSCIRSNPKEFVRAVIKNLETQPGSALQAWLGTKIGDVERIRPSIWEVFVSICSCGLQFGSSGFQCGVVALKMGVMALKFATSLERKSCECARAFIRTSQGSPRGVECCLVWSIGGGAPHLALGRSFWQGCDSYVTLNCSSYGCDS